MLLHHEPWAFGISNTEYIMITLLLSIRQPSLRITTSLSRGEPDAQLRSYPVHEGVLSTNVHVFLPLYQWPSPTWKAGSMGTTGQRFSYRFLILTDMIVPTCFVEGNNSAYHSAVLTQRGGNKNHTWSFQQVLY